MEWSIWLWLNLKRAWVQNEIRGDVRGVLCSVKVRMLGRDRIEQLRCSGSPVNITPRNRYDAVRFEDGQVFRSGIGSGA